MISVKVTTNDPFTREKDGRFKRYLDQMQDPARQAVTFGRVKWQEVREPIKCILTGGISASYVLVGAQRYGERSSNLVGQLQVGEVVLSGRRYDLSDRKMSGEE
jgi:hypothetical protein